jgi:cysteine desulfurase / selenocysteine lyase
MPEFPEHICFGRSIKLFQKIGPENVMNRVLYLNRLIEQKLRQLGIELIVQKEDKHRSGILIVKIPNPKLVVEELFKKNIFVSARGEGMRVSASIFNNEEDIEVFTKELAVILKH